MDCCATRLRCTVFKAELVNDVLLKSTGASGVVHKGNGVQIIYGPRVTVIKSNLEDYLETAPNEEYTAGDVKETAAREQKETPGANVVKTVIISSPVTGTAADLSEAPDEAFAGRMMGDGAVVTPKDSIVRAPEDGEVCFVFETKHAVGFMTDTGLSILIHMGIDTVALNGQGFEVLVENGQKVKLLDDRKYYLGAQLCRASGEERCYGIAADEGHLLVCEYGEGGSDPAIVLYRRR